jgi:hypothetical protein
VPNDDRKPKHNTPTMAVLADTLKFTENPEI